ncbi:MAG: MOSC N-terminal beta barrel domain-containing protein [Pseudomonadota bacterium]|uniref:MOSC domain-containing protein n=1 Tax=Curvibacter delicatus TaxID=80879 RepID=UPI00083191AF|nr:MOSC N-terminal beta barrel domain-containing protein [Curvibacter delicatus]MEA3394061.1 MOSC N-terminal beta barrel domain-containing protein [Pseudomonadota bacterium]
MSESTVSPGDVQARITQLFVYPVKSCAGIALQETVLTETGFDLDRAWMVVDAQGGFVSQREQPRLALVLPEFKRGGTELVLRAPGMLALHLAVDVVEQPTRVRVWDDEVPAYDMGDVAAQWFTDFLSLSDQGLPTAQAAKYRLVRFDPEHRRVSSLKWTDGVEALNQFSDGFPLLVLGQASLDEFNTRLQAGGHAPVGVERFRPNIVLADLEAHDEDRLDTLRIATGEGDVVLKPVKPCPRCPIPNIDPATALSSPEVSDTLQAYRRDARLNGAVTFGMNAIALTGVDAVLRVGQLVAADFRFD